MLEIVDHLERLRRKMVHDDLQRLQAVDILQGVKHRVDDLRSRQIQTLQGFTLVHADMLDFAVAAFVTFLLLSFGFFEELLSNSLLVDILIYSSPYLVKHSTSDILLENFKLLT